MKRLTLILILVVSVLLGFSQGNIGINTLTPESALDVNGKIKIADDATAPLAGMIKYDSVSGDFLGYNGTEWMSLTMSNMNEGGILPPSKYKNLPISKPWESVGDYQLLANENNEASLIYQVGADLVALHYRDGSWSSVGNDEYVAEDVLEWNSAINDNGKVLLSYTKINMSGNRELFLLEYENDAWGSSVKISPDFSQVFYAPEIAMNTDKAYIIWRQPDAVCDRLFLSSYENGSWSHPSNYFDYFNPNWGNGSANDPIMLYKIAISNSDRAVIYYTQSVGATKKLYLAENDGSSWTVPSSATDHVEEVADGLDLFVNISNLRLAAGGDNDFCLVYQIVDDFYVVGDLFVNVYFRLKNSDTWNTTSWINFYNQSIISSSVSGSSGKDFILYLNTMNSYPSVSSRLVHIVTGVPSYYTKPVEDFASISSADITVDDFEYLYSVNLNGTANAEDRNTYLIENDDEIDYRNTINLIDNIYPASSQLKIGENGSRFVVWKSNEGKLYSIED